MDRIKGYFQNIVVILVVIGGICLISFLHKSCVGAFIQLVPDDGEYVVTDDDYYHRTIRCACVYEDNFVDDIDYKTAKEEGLKPCPYCKPKN